MTPQAADLKQEFLEKLDEKKLKKYEFDLDDYKSATAIEADIEQLAEAAQQLMVVMPTKLGYNTDALEQV